MDTQVCKICGEVKSIDNFSMRKYPSGAESPRKDCKECRSKKEGERQKDNSGKLKSKVESPVPVLENQLEFTSPMEKIEPIRLNTVNQFTTDEVRQLRQMLSGKFIVSESIDRSARVAKTLNMDVKVMEWLQMQARQSNVSVSDVINAMVRGHMN